MRRIAVQQPKTRHWLVDALLSMFSDGIFKVAPPPAERQPKARDAYTEIRAEAKRWRRYARNRTLARRSAFGPQPFTGPPSKAADYTVGGSYV